VDVPLKSKVTITFFVIFLLELVISASSAVQPFEPLEVEQTPQPPLKQK
jgi:hypothetical protein